MLKKAIIALLAMMGVLTIAGCIIVIQQPSAEEKQLMGIQDKVIEQIASVNQRITSGNYSQEEINKLLTSAQQVVDESLAALNKLNLPEKAQKLAEQTKQYLEAAKGLYAEMQKMVGEFDKLKEQAAQFSTQAQGVINEQIKNAQKGINDFKKQLDTVSNQLIEMKSQIEKQYQTTP